MKERMAILLYDTEHVKRLNVPKELEANFKIKEIDEELEDYVEVTQTGNQTFIKSTIIDGLKEITDYALKDHKRITRIRLTGKRKIDNMIKKDVKNYYEDRVQNHANEIIDYVSGLIQRDEFPESMFGNYKSIKIALDNSDGKLKDNYLTKLIICALTSIPKEVIETEHVTVEPRIVSAKRTAESTDT